MKILVTGAHGFIGKNLTIKLREQKKYEILSFGREDDPKKLAQWVVQADFIFHLAGANRPSSLDEFEKVNVDLTAALCDQLSSSAKLTPVVYTSSTKAEDETPYGVSKKSAENILLNWALQSDSLVYIFRLPNVFGKWCRPNYNSAIATFCHNTVHELPLVIHDPNLKLELVYIDDLVNKCLSCLEGDVSGSGFYSVTPTYPTTVGEVASIIQSFPTLRSSFFIDRVGAGLIRALYSTYLSYLPPNDFHYTLPVHEDARGVFVEMLRTPDCGQFSYFTAKPGITRGGHYHHTKAEKFLVIQGDAHFGFKHILSGEQFSVTTSGLKPEVVETVPGWSHNITNVGGVDLIVLLWANEVFDVNHPDTIGYEV